MLIIFFRALVLYIIVLVVMRLMGKREIGQLQPFELAIAIMIAGTPKVKNIPTSSTPLKNVFNNSMLTVTPFAQT